MVKRVTIAPDAGVVGGKASEDRWRDYNAPRNPSNMQLTMFTETMALEQLSGSGAPALVDQKFFHGD